MLFMFFLFNKKKVLILKKHHLLAFYAVTCLSSLVFPLFYALQIGLMCCTVLFCRFLFSCINKKTYFSDIDVSLEKSRRGCVFS